MSNDDNAKIKYDPNPIKILWDDYTDTRACADIVSYMNGYEDPRLSHYFQKRTDKKTPEYHGLRTGINISSKEWALKYSAPNANQSDDLMWLNAAEVAFLRAEGALRQWNMGGTSKDLYNEGIKLSFSQYKLGEADAYLFNSTRKPGDYKDDSFGETAKSTITIKWNEADAEEVKLERVITQKWIAMYPLGMEAWGEHRRTGYPRFFKVLDNRNSDQSLSTNLASRIPFSPRERDTNRENYNDAIKMLGGLDNYSTKLWWDKNTNKP